MPNFEVIFKQTYSDACVFCYFRGGKTVFYSADKIPAWERAWSDAWNRFCAYENNGSKYVFSYKRGIGIGTAALDRIELSGNTELWRRNWSADWDNFTIEHLNNGDIKLISTKPSKIDHDILNEDGPRTIASYYN